MSNQAVLKVQNFTRFPGPRYRELGPSSGEQFREEHLIPMVKKFGKDLVIDLDGVMGYGSSFLEESFGGAVRSGAVDGDLLTIIVSHVICEDEPTLKEEILGYIRDAVTMSKSHAGLGM